MKRHIPAIFFVLALAGFTTYMALDTFVISRAYDVKVVENTSMFEENGSVSVGTGENESAENSAKTGENASAENSAGAGENSVTNTPSNSIATLPSLVASGGSYTSETAAITLYEYNEHNTSIYVADVVLTSAEYLKTAFANNTYGKNVTATTSSIAKANQAVLAINGDFYGTQEKGYVIRNGVVYRDSAKGADVLCVYADGSMEIVNDREYTAKQLVDMNVWQAFSFGPGLIENGEITVDGDDEVSKAMVSNPRTAIGIIDANHFVFVVSDGRTGESEGLSLLELAQFMKSLGVKTAYNLDGGGSSTMYFNGEIINNPTSGGRIKERKVSDIVYIG